MIAYRWFRTVTHLATEAFVALFERYVTAPPHDDTWHAEQQEHVTYRAEGTSPADVEHAIRHWQEKRP